MLRIVDVPCARQLIATLTVLATALAIALPCDRSVSATWLSDTAAGKYKVDIRKTVLDSFRVVFDTTGVQQHRCFCRPPNLGRSNNVCGWNTGYGLGKFWRICS